MVGADFLKLRKRRGTLAWSLLLALVPLLLYFIVGAAQHSSNPAEHAACRGHQRVTRTRCASSPCSSGRSLRS